MTDKCLRWLETKQPESPALVFDLSAVKKKFNFIKNLYNNIEVFYAVKANPNKIIKLLNRLGSSFDCASIEEIKYCISSSVSPNNISYGSTIKKEVDIEEAFKLGVNLYAFDSYEELTKISKKAPGSYVFCGTMVANGGLKWPLSKSLAVLVKLQKKLIFKAKTKLNPIGVSFHVGSQQLSIETWKRQSLRSKCFKSLSKKDISLSFWI